MMLTAQLLAPLYTLFPPSTLSSPCAIWLARACLFWAGGDRIRTHPPTVVVCGLGQNAAQGVIILQPQGAVFRRCDVRRRPGRFDSRADKERAMRFEAGRQAWALGRWGVRQRQCKRAHQETLECLGISKLGIVRLPHNFFVTWDLVKDLPRSATARDLPAVDLVHLSWLMCDGCGRRLPRLCRTTTSQPSAASRPKRPSPCRTKTQRRRRRATLM